MKGHATLMSSASDDWATPPDFYAVVARQFPFILDAAASEANAKCPRFYTEADNGLAHPWASWTWCNPPYSLVGEFCDKAIAEATFHQVSSVLLVPARTDTRWFHRIAARADEIRLLKGRLKFGDGRNSAPFPSALIITRGRPAVGNGLPFIRLWDWREDAREDAREATA